MVNARGVEFGKRVRHYRAACGMSMEDLAAAVALSYGYIRSIERGHKAIPPVETVERFAAVLGVTINDLIDAERPLPLSTQQMALQLSEEAIKAIKGVPVRIDGTVPADAVQWKVVEEQEDRDVHVTREQLGNAHDPFAVIVSGDCLRSFLIGNRYRVICDRPDGRRPSENQWVLVRIENEVTFGAWFPVGEGVEVRDGEGVVRYQIENRETVEILGFYITHVPPPR